MLDVSQIWIDYEMLDNSVDRAALEARLWDILEFYDICVLGIDPWVNEDYGNGLDCCGIDFINLSNVLPSGDIIGIVEEVIRSCNMIPYEYTWSSCTYPSDFIETVADFYGMSMNAAKDALRKANYI